MKAAARWRAIESELPAGWATARVRVTVSDPSRVGRAAAVLGPLNPGRLADNSLVIDAVRAGGVSTLRRSLARLDAEGIDARVELVESTRPDARDARRHSLVEAWDAAVAALPDDWSDVYAELELESSDHVAPAALRLAPCNPARVEARKLRFRVARRSGYGTSPEMTRRCLERLDEDGIRGAVRILHALSDTDHVHTQGPVWYVEGKAV